MDFFDIIVFIKGLLDGKSFSFALFFTIIIMSKTLIARLKNILSPIGYFHQYTRCVWYLLQNFQLWNPDVVKEKGVVTPQKTQTFAFCIL